MNIHDTVLSCILGLAVGDALGVPFEFMPRGQAASADLRHMPSKSYYHTQPAGAWSDDTAMTLASMDSLIRCRGFDPDDMMQAFLGWYRFADYTSTGETFGVGRTVYAALRMAMKGVPALLCGQAGIRDNGNGSLMRFAPTALYCIFCDLPRKEALHVITQSSAITHAHPISLLGCLIYEDFLRSLILERNKEQAYNSICNTDYTMVFPGDAVKAYERILNRKLPELREENLRESGYVVDTLEAALWATLRERSYADTITAVIRLGYDTDTVAAVTGSICGALYGVEGIPLAWQDELLKRPYLQQFCERFSSMLSGVETFSLQCKANKLELS